MTIPSKIFIKKNSINKFLIKILVMLCIVDIFVLKIILKSYKKKFAYFYVRSFYDHISKNEKAKKLWQFTAMWSNFCRNRCLHYSEIFILQLVMQISLPEHCNYVYSWFTYSSWLKVTDTEMRKNIARLYGRNVILNIFILWSWCQ